MTADTEIMSKENETDRQTETETERHGGWGGGSCLHKPFWLSSAIFRSQTGTRRTCTVTFHLEGWRSVLIHAADP